MSGAGPLAGTARIGRARRRGRGGTGGAVLGRCGKGVDAEMRRTAWRDAVSPRLSSLAGHATGQYHRAMSARLRIPAAIAAIAADGQQTARQRRHFLLQRLLLRGSVGTGTQLASLRRRTAMQPWPDLRAHLSELPWAVVGGVATRAYMQERITQDLEVIVRKLDGAEALARLAAAEFKAVGALSIGGQTLRSPDGAEIDLLFGEQPWLDEALTRTERDPAGFPVLGLPFLVVLKMQSARTQDWADVSRMLGQANDPGLSHVREVVERWSPEDSEDLEALIFLGQQEMRPPED